jgi:hypothetical protein
MQITKYTAILLITTTMYGCAHHPADCAIGIPWSDCLEGTAGYNNGGGSETREIALKLEMAKKQASGSDLYTELTKLDDLRKKGILTEDEYTEQKKKLLEKK